MKQSKENTRDGERPAPNPAPCGTRDREREDSALFSTAVRGVSPLLPRGRETLPPGRPFSRGTKKSLFPAVMDKRRGGCLDFSLVQTGENVIAHVAGLDPAVLGKLKAGSYSVEGRLDLHGQTLDEAQATLASFLRAASGAGKRHLLLITGRGNNSPGGRSILREEVQGWLTAEPFKRALLAFCTAKPNDGGLGAFYLLLRNNGKKGKAGGGDA
ncbi:hypothetical protein FACS1894206_02790 [Deltaproteobacteria bacterium]|nr:hypothetical protein FACS1894206_02790 [Deltaproteobacteria bacterium]